MRLPFLRLLLPCVLLMAWGVAPAARSSDSPSGSSQYPNDSSREPQRDQSKDEQKKKDNKDNGSQDVNTEVFSTAVASNVLNDLRDGLEGHTRRLMLSAFDADKMAGYPEFEDQIQAFFSKYQSFRVYFRIVQSATEGSKGVVLVDIQLEEVPLDATALPIRKNGQMRFELERGRKGWKIVDLSPRNFFS